MNKKQSKEFEKKLLKKRQAIGQNPVRIPGSETGSNPEYGRDEGDRATASQAKEMVWLRTSQERSLLKLIDAALLRIQDGTFGECLHCGQDIGERRLTAVPWARYCITCQELLEQYGS
jgi:DnaK suppressor protein